MILINHLNTYINKGVIEAIDDNQRMLLRKHIPANPTKLALRLGRNTQGPDNHHPS